MKESLFILNFMHCDLVLPYELFPNIILRRATSDEKNAIKIFLSSFSTNKNLTHLYEFSIKEYKFTETPWQVSYSTEIELNENNWNYFVITTSGNFSNREKLQKAAYLSSYALRLDMTLPEMGGIMCSMSAIFNFFNDPHHGREWSKAEFNKTNYLTADFIEELKGIFTLLNSYPSQDDLITEVIKMYLNIKTISWDTATGVLQFFTIWEILLSHKPIGTGDSLTNQLKTKIPLLNNRMSEQIKYSNYCVGVGQTKESTIIEKLYSYRSDIVHGTKIDFINKFKMFKERENVKELLKEITRKLILHSLKEPQLILDLKEC